MTDSLSHLAALRVRVARIEGQKGESEAERIAFGSSRLDACIQGGLQRGRLHEVIAKDENQMGCMAGVAAMLALRSDGTSRDALWLRTDRAERQSGRLYGPGLADLGLDLNRLLLAILPDDAALLHAAIDAARCPALAMLIIESWGNPRQLDMTTSRRLTLAAEASGVTILLLRMAADALPSAAMTRWQVNTMRSIAMPMRAPGHPALTLALQRQRGGAFGHTWTLEWRRDDRRFRDAPLSGAGFPQIVGEPLAAAPTRRSA